MARQHFADSTIWASQAPEIDPPDIDIYRRGYESGAGKTPPSAAVHNNLFNRSDQQHQHIEQNGIPVWDARTAYALRGLCLGPDGIIYQSKVNGNTNSDPRTSPTKWQFFWSADKVIDFQTKIDANTQLTRDNKNLIARNGSRIDNLDSQQQSTQREVDNMLYNVFSHLFPPGSVVMRDTDPGNSIYAGGLGVGYWVRKSGVVPVGAGSHTDGSGYHRTFYSGSEYGEYNHKLSVAEMPAHYHGSAGEKSNGPFGNMPGMTNRVGFKGGADYDNNVFKTTTEGGSSPHNNIQPCFGVTIWYRVS